MRPVIKKSAKSEVVAVGNESIGCIYLEKRGCITVGERMSIDEHETRRQKAGIIAAKLVKRISVDKGITIEEAQNLLSPKRANPDEAEVDNSAIVYDYIEDFTELNTLSALDGVSVATAIATIFIQNRVAYPVEVTEVAKLNATKLSIAPTSFYIKDKQQIKFGNCIVTVKGNHDVDSEVLSVHPISERVFPGSGFLYNGRRYQIGTEEWTEKDTKELDETLITEIFNFYQNERAGWVTTETPADTDADVDTGDLAEGELPQLTGMTSTGESNPTA